MYVGRFAIRSVLFPYGNKIITKYLDGQVNEKFGSEFAKILEKAYYIIKENMIETVKKEDMQESKHFQFNHSISIFFIMNSRSYEYMRVDRAIFEHKPTDY